MNIGIVTPSIPYPPDEGGRLVVYNRIVGLSDCGHDIYLFAAADEPPSEEALDTLSINCTSFVYVSRQTGLQCYLNKPRLPYSIGSRYLPQLQQELRERTDSGKLDVVLIEHTHMSAYTADITVPACLSVHNIESRTFLANSRNLLPIPTAVPHLIEAARMYAYERSLFGSDRFDAYAFLSRSEQRRIESVSPHIKAKSNYLPFGVDSSRFNGTSADIRDDDDPLLVFTGTMRYPPNVDAMEWFVEEIFPRVREAIPAVELFIVGKSPTAAVEALGDTAGVTVTGRVDATEPYLQAADVSIVPLREATGLQIKLLEALAAGNVTVTTPIGVAGMDAKNGTHVLVAEDADEFTATLIKVLNNPAEFESIAASAQRLVAETYARDTVINELERILIQAANS